ncbi:MAG: DUF4160 domain-containing protein [Acidobacteriota bacterium]
MSPSQWQTSGKGPTVFRAAGLRFFFFWREEPLLHIHAIGSSGEPKFWLEPELELAVNYGLSDRTAAKALSLIKEHEDEIRRAWEQRFGR